MTDDVTSAEEALEKAKQRKAVKPQSKWIEAIGSALVAVIFGGATLLLVHVVELAAKGVRSAAISFIRAAVEPPKVKP